MTSDAQYKSYINNGSVDIINSRGNGMIVILKFRKPTATYVASKYGSTYLLLLEGSGLCIVNANLAPFGGLRAFATLPPFSLTALIRLCVEKAIVKRERERSFATKTSLVSTGIVFPLPELVEKELSGNQRGGKGTRAGGLVAELSLHAICTHPQRFSSLQVRLPGDFVIVVDEESGIEDEEPFLKGFVKATLLQQRPLHEGLGQVEGKLSLGLPRVLLYYFWLCSCRGHCVIYIYRRLGMLFARSKVDNFAQSLHTF